MRFDDLKSRFWDGSSSFGVLDPLTDRRVAEAEQTLAVRLPTAYLELLRVQNGGSVNPEFDAHPTVVPTSWAENHVPFPAMMGIGPPGLMISILDSPELNQGWEQPKELVLLSGDGHYWVALDYRRCGGAGEPSVVWFDNEIGEDIQLAPAFLTFVEGLCPSEDFPVE